MILHSQTPTCVVYGPGFFPPTVSSQEQVLRLQTELLKMPQADITTEHVFLGGRYERRITIPPWTVLTGAEHKTAYRVRLEQGTIAVNTDAGVKVLTAPLEFDAPAGVQRAGRVFAEAVVWVDVYDNPDNCTDLPTLEARLYVVPEVGLADSRTDIQKAWIDFGAFLHQMNMTQNELDAIAKIDSDLIEMPAEFRVELRDSPIHGKGLFASAPFSPGEVICPGRINGHRTPGGRYINHSGAPNVEPKKFGDDIYAVAVKQIAVGDELLVNYRDSVQVNFGITLQGESS